MKPITQNDLDKIELYAGQTPTKVSYKELTDIYSKLDYLCKAICKNGFEYSIRQDPRKVAGSNITFREYQWAKIYPKGMKNSCKDYFAYVVGLSDSLHFHMMGVGDYQSHPLSTKASNTCWTELDIENFNYEEIAEKFREFDKKYRKLFIETGVGFGIAECIKIKEELFMEDIIKLLIQKGQIVLQGPPGTGKTYTAKDVAEKLIFDDISADKNSQKIRLDASGQFKLVQFHPSYTYEDFVRGIIAESNNNQIEYLTVNRVFADFCLAAYQNLKDSLKKPEEITREQWLLENFEDFKEQIQEELDESNGILELNSTVNIIGVEDDAFRYTGNVWKNQFRMKYSDIIKLYNLGIRERREIKHEKSLNSLANQHSTYFKFILDRFYVFMQGKTQPIATVDVIQKKNFIMVIDEMNRANLPSVLGELIYGLEYRDESFDTMYDLDGNKQLIIPSNLFIIGTMNTADRSVGHIDYAIRRRFAFVDILPTEEPINTPEGKELFRKVSELFVKVENGKVKFHVNPLYFR